MFFQQKWFYKCLAVMKLHYRGIIFHLLKTNKLFFVKQTKFKCSIFLYDIYKNILQKYYNKKIILCSGATDFSVYLTILTCSLKSDL